MRDFSFRAWHPTERKMVYFTFADINHFGDVLAPDFDGRYCVLSECEIMQSTGIVDRRGEEIYEGDILATSNINPGYDLWTREDFGFTAVYWHDTLCRFLGTAWQWDIGTDSIYGLPFVGVIGDVWEHPGLPPPRGGDDR